ncbi:hypothetical protein N7448_008484 [Penicillium atrosanguineum]|uniref:uncharacterized protein n=1 Tax=Penicillium atrosanguineum TaxID=1132637 RepID=UPI0023940882|nr:uncharacterized protein N7443_000503 [Penicillium atrosanguineum]KAJ5127705.1 hypothetical protein N7448_008484 [Penicillium atrosanguineum]KAJ5313619.1 hypothetical protein N7443_000503 [Penicillium atrosanguineum]
MQNKFLPSPYILLEAFIIAKAKRATFSKIIRLLSFQPYGRKTSLRDLIGPISVGLQLRDSSLIREAFFLLRTPKAPLSIVGKPINEVLPLLLSACFKSENSSFVLKEAVPGESSAWKMVHALIRCPGSC